MRRIEFSLAAVLLLLCCACTPTADGPEGGDGYIPVAGLSFGMSVEEAMKAYPGLKEVEALLPWPQDAEILYGSPNDLPEFYVLRGATDFLLENAKVYGEAVTVRLRFLNQEAAVIDDEAYTYDSGLQTVTVTFPLSVKKGAILHPLEEMFDFHWEDAWEDANWEETTMTVDLLSKNQPGALDDETREILLDYLTNFPLTRKSDGHQISADFSQRFHTALEKTSGIGAGAYSRYRNFAAGSFIAHENELRLDGFLAGILYQAQNVTLEKE